MPPEFKFDELPVHLQHSAIVELARVFCHRLGGPRANDLELAGFTDLADLILRGLIQREGGRYSIGYMPGAEVIAEMWKLDPTLCSVLNLKRVEGNQSGHAEHHVPTMEDERRVA